MADGFDVRKFTVFMVNRSLIQVPYFPKSGVQFSDHDCYSPLAPEMAITPVVPSTGLMTFSE